MAHWPASQLRVRRNNRIARGSERGGLSVEALIVISMMTVIATGIFFMRKVYSGKLATMTASRADAWKLALAGCDSGDQGKLYETIHQQSKDKNAKLCKDPNDCSTDSVDGLNDDGSSSPPPGWFPSASGDEVTKNISVSSDPHSATLSTSRRFSCNEKPAKELQLGSLNLLGQVADIAKKIIDEEVDEDTTAKTCWQKYGVPIKWHQMNCETDLTFKNNNDPAGLYSQRRDLDVSLPDNSKH